MRSGDSSHVRFECLILLYSFWIKFARELQHARGVCLAQSEVSHSWGVDVCKWPLKT